MKNQMCPIIADLLPSYIEGLTSAETNIMIADHLADCDECRQLLEDYTAEVELPDDLPSKQTKKILSRLRFPFFWYLFWPLLYGALQQFGQRSAMPLFSTALAFAFFTLFSSRNMEYNFDLDDTKKSFYDQERRLRRKGKGGFFAEGVFWILPILLPTILLFIPVIRSVLG